MTDSSILQGSSNVFEDLGFSAQEAQKLMIRSDLMLQIRTLIQAKNWTMSQAAAQLSLSSAEIQALLEGKIGEFNIEQLISILSRAGMKVRIEVLSDVA